jgi:hypothetical protein
VSASDRRRKMLINVYTEDILVHQGTRMLAEPLGLIGRTFEDPYITGRMWTAQGEYAPVEGRALGGIRIKLVDQKGFVTFLNQRDLEVLMGLGKPGKYCYWAGLDYVGPKDREWYGFCTDEEDLLDDLYEQELMLRVDYPEVLPELLELTRRVHLGPGRDVEDMAVLLRDYDPTTGVCPDPRFETINRRWSRIEQRRVRWEFL